MAACILLLRYQNDNSSYLEKTPSTSPQIVRQILNLNLIKRPNQLSSNIVKLCILLFAIVTPFFCVLIDAEKNWLVYTGVAVTGICLLVLVLIIDRQPKVESSELNIKVPAIPILPLISIFMNLYLMCQLEHKTWIRFAIWIAIGYAIYFTYGVRRSIESNREKLELSEHGQVRRNTNINNNNHNNNSSTVQHSQQ